MFNYGMPYMNNMPVQSLDTIIQETQNRLDNFKQQRDQLLQNSQQVPMQQPTNLTQNFQLASNNTGNIRLVNSIEDVQKEIVLADTYFIANSLNGLWIKNARGEIRTFQLVEVKPKDEKDLIIEKLQRELESLKEDKIDASTYEYNESNGEQLSKQSNTNIIGTNGNETTTNKSSNVSTIQDCKTTKRKS